MISNTNNNLSLLRAYTYVVSGIMLSNLHGLIYFSQNLYELGILTISTILQSRKLRLTNLESWLVVEPAFEPRPTLLTSTL